MKKSPKFAWHCAAQISALVDEQARPRRRGVVDAQHALHGRVSTYGALYYQSPRRQPAGPPHTHHWQWGCK